MLLKENGFDTVEKVAEASVEDLSKVPGVGPATAAAMNIEANNLLKQTEKGKK